MQKGAEGRAGVSQLPQEEGDEQLSESTAPLPPMLSSAGAAQGDVGSCTASLLRYKSTQGMSCDTEGWLCSGLHLPEQLQQRTAGILCHDIYLHISNGLATAVCK